MSRRARGCFSFYPGKNLGAYGEGGAVVTDDPDVARRLRLLRDHGSEQKYRHEIVGYNFRLEGLQGAVLGVKLRHLDDWNALRRAHAARYTELLGGLESDGALALPREMPYAEHVYHLYVVRTEARDALQQALQEAGVQTGIHTSARPPATGYAPGHGSPETSPRPNASAPRPLAPDVPELTRADRHASRRRLRGS